MADVQDVRPLSAQLSKYDCVTKLVALFNIPLALMECLATLSLQFAFKKFQAGKSLQEQIQTRIADGTWVGKSPSKDEVIEIFISKSVWYNRFKHFNDVEPKSKLYLWLEGDAEAASGLEVFGVTKDN